MFQPAAQEVDEETEVRVCRVVAIRVAREARLAGLRLGCPDTVGPFPENPQLYSTEWITVSTECLHIAPFLPQRNSS